MNILRLTRYFAPVLLAGLLFLSCRRDGAERQEGPVRPVSPDATVVATVNGDPITLGEFQERFSRAGIKPEQGSGSEVRVQFLNNLIERKMMLREAQRRRIKVSLQEINRRIEMMQTEHGKNIKDVLAGQGVDYEKWKADVWEDMMMEKLKERDVNRQLAVSSTEVRRYYQANIRQFERPEQVRVRQIVVATEDEAHKVLEALQNKADFASLAREKSTAPEAPKGGDLGYFAQGEMPPEFNVVFTLPVKGISGVVKSPYGFHIFKLEEERPAGVRSLDEASQEIEGGLLNEKKDRKYMQWLKELMSRTKFEVNYQALEQ